MKKRIGLLSLCALLMFTGCGASGDTNKTAAFEAPQYASGTTDGVYFSEDYEYAEEYKSADNGSSTAGSESVRDGRKLIRTADLSVETLEFDKLLSYVRNRTDELGGYIENMNVNNGSGYSSYSSQSSGYRRDRSANLTLRIPKKNLDDFLGEVAENSNVTSRSEQERDVTTDYVDLESHKKVLLAEQERLMTFLEQAETIEDMMSIESRLSDIRYQLESMESMLRTYDSQIEYSTVTLYISEVVELTPVVEEEQTVWERISEGFLRSLRNIGRGLKEFFVAFVIALPYLVITLLIVLALFGIVYAIVKKCMKSHEKKLAKKQAQMQAAQAAYYQRMQQTAGGQIPPVPRQTPANAGQNKPGQNAMSQNQTPKK